MNLRDGYVALTQAAAAAVAVFDRGLVSEWADAHRWLTAKSSPEPGPWRTARVPYAREIMDALSDDVRLVIHDEHGGTHTVDAPADIAFMAASQVVKTEIGLNWIGYTIHRSPAPMLVVEPTVDMAEKYSKQRVGPMIAHCAELRDKIAPPRERGSGNTTLVKDFGGGMLIMAGSNSASTLASMPIAKLFLDETDRYPDDVGDEGDPIELAVQRTVNFPRAKRYKASTPGLVRPGLTPDESERLPHIAKEYEGGTRARYWVPCPHCDAFQVLEFERLKWDKAVDAQGRKEHRTETARYFCAECGAAIDESDKSDMLARGQWRHRNPERAALSYHINALYSPGGLGRSWAEIADAWIKAHRDAAKLQSFFNLILGLPFRRQVDRVDATKVAERAGAWLQRTVPTGHVVLTLGVDTQDDRLSATLVAWAEGERAAIIDRVVFWGDPIGSQVWDELTAYRRRPVRNRAGVDLYIAMTAIDSGGHRTQSVYQYARRFQNERVIAAKGHSIAGRPILGRPSKVDIKNDRGEVQHAGGALLWMIGADTAKDAIYARLGADALVDDEAARMIRFAGGLGADYYAELCAETRDARKGAYVKLRQRNEALDELVAALAAAQHPSVRVHRMTVGDWGYLRTILEPRVGDLFAGGQAEDISGQAEGAAETAQAATVPTGEPVAVGLGADDWIGSNADDWLAD